MEFRELTADEIEVRVQSVKLNQDKTPKGLVLLLYKNARCDMNILDETVGPANWQREHYECKGNLFCRVGINTNYKLADSLPNWVYKSDCGVESNTEAQKGEASDSFKRACFNWGIGRELYTAPFIWIPAEKVNTYNTKRKDKYGNPVFATNDRFAVGKIAIEDKKIVGISIHNLNKGERVFVWQKQ